MDQSVKISLLSESMILKAAERPLELSDIQIAAFKSVIHANSRPIQPLNGREHLLDVAEGGSNR